MPSITWSRTDLLHHRILAFIESYQREHGYGPTVREIADLCGLSSPSVAHYHLARLERQGFIERTPGLDRSVRVKPPAETKREG